MVSAAFNFLEEKRLGEYDSKEYAAKNIMVNLHSIFRKTVQSVIDTVQRQEKLQDKINVKEFRQIFMVEVDSMINNILINLADNYPQAPVTGGTPRMREAITEINRVED